MAQDKTGRTINTGDTLAYCGRQGSSIWLTIGKVLGTDGDRVQVRGEGNTRAAWITTSASRSVVLDREPALA